MLMTPKEWRVTMFTKDSRPHIQTVYRWMKAGKVPVRTIGRTCYIVEGEEIVDAVKPPVIKLKF